MSQLGVYGTTTKYNTGIVMDVFGTITLTTAVAQNFKNKEKITGSTSGATAVVSGVVNVGTNTILRVKSVKTTTAGTVFANGETITGAKSLQTAVVASTDAVTGTIASGFVLQNASKRQVNGALTTVAYQQVSEDDGGIKISQRNTGSSRTFRPVGYINSFKMARSLAENTDTSVKPTVYFTSPKSGEYSISGKNILSWSMLSDESLTVTGTPRIAVLDAGSAHTLYANFVPSKSTDQQLFFELPLSGQTFNAGQIVSAIFGLNGGTITDVGGSALGGTWNLPAQPAPITSSGNTINGFVSTAGIAVGMTLSVSSLGGGTQTGTITTGTVTAVTSNSVSITAVGTAFGGTTSTGVIFQVTGLPTIGSASTSGATWTTIPTVGITSTGNVINGLNAAVTAGIYPGMVLAVNTLGGGSQAGTLSNGTVTAVTATSITVTTVGTAFSGTSATGVVFTVSGIVIAA